MKDIALSALGLAGILLHSLIKLYQLKKQPTIAVVSEYFKTEWLSMLISACIVVVALICKKEILNLDIAGNIAGNYLGLLYFVIGYMGQSVLLTFLGKFASKAGIQDSTIPAIVMLAGLTMLFSCANEKHFVKYHDKQPAKAIGYCIAWNPTKDSVHESVSYLPGETQIIPGEVIYANCDSAYQSALDEVTGLRQNGMKIVVKRVTVPCPPSTVRVDTFFKDKFVQVRYTAIEDTLKRRLNTACDLASRLNKESAHRGYMILGLLAVIVAYSYFRLKSSYSRA